MSTYENHRLEREALDWEPVSPFADCPFTTGRRSIDQLEDFPYSIRFRKMCYESQMMIQWIVETAVDAGTVTYCPRNSPTFSVCFKWSTLCMLLRTTMRSDIFSRVSSSTEYSDLRTDNLQLLRYWERWTIWKSIACVIVLLCALNVGGCDFIWTKSRFCKYVSFEICSCKLFISCGWFWLIRARVFSMRISLVADRVQGQLACTKNRYSTGSARQEMFTTQPSSGKVPLRGFEIQAYI